jgi:Heterokaryon incompatibility protein (HET)
MPPTFHDAIEVTRNLDFRYLWVDSLCITQGDPVELQSESQKMCEIFESSSCTIATVDSVAKGIDRGLFLPCDSDPLAVKLSLPLDKTPLSTLSRKIFPEKDSVYVWKYM